MTPEVADEIKASLELAIIEAWAEYYKVVKPAREARREAEAKAESDYSAIREPAWKRCCEAIDGAMEAFHHDVEAANKKGRP